MTDIFEATLAGDTESVATLLAEAPGLVHAVNDNDRNPLHYAAREGHPDTVRLLLDKGADVDRTIYPNREMTRPRTLADARRHDDVVAVIDEFKTSVAPSASSRGEKLCETARSADPDRMRELLAAGTDNIDDTDLHGRTALHWAAEAGYLAVARTLLDHGADPDARDRSDLTPIHRALMQHPFSDHKPSFAVAGLLLARGAKIDVWVAAGLGDVPMLEGLLRADPAQADATFVRRPLDLAAQHGHLDAVKCLLDYGADPDAPMVVDPNSPDPYINIGAPLQFAVRGGHRDVVEALLQAGANPNTRLMASGNAASDAYSSGRDDIAELIFRHGGIPDIHSCHDRGNWAAILQAFEFAPDRASKELLSLEIPDLTRICLKQKPEFTRREQFNRMFEAMRANTGDMEVIRTKCEILQMYLDYGFDPNVRSQENISLLHRVTGCMWRGRWANSQEAMIEFTRVLLDAGADPNARDEDIKSTPMGWHARYGHDEVIEYLLSRGLSSTLPDDEDWNAPLAWAQKEGHDRIAEILSSTAARDLNRER